MTASTSGIVTGMPRSTRLVTPCSRHAAGHDAGEVREVRLDVQADAVEGHPAPDPDADGGDLVLRGLALVGPAHPHADPVLPPLAADVEGIEGGDEPGLQGRHVAAQVRRAAAAGRASHRPPAGRGRDRCTARPAPSGGPGNGRARRGPRPGPRFRPCRAAGARRARPVSRACPAAIASARASMKATASS